jgi:hypothetical protein
MCRTYQIIGVAAFLTCSLNVHAQTRNISEPIFGIQYNPTVVHFDKAPPLIGKACSDMRGKNVLVYAHLVDQDTQYFVVQEYLGEFGVGIAIQGAHCAEIDLDRFLYEGTDALSQQGVVVKKDDERRIMDNLAKDILTQYATAFGGRENFLRALGTRADDLPRSALRTELEQYRKAK